MTGDEKPSNYYSDIHTRVVLKEGDGKEQRTLLDLHDVDPDGLMKDQGMNDTFVGKVENTFRSLRREGIDMGTAPQGSFRSFQEQDSLYAKGRTRPGRKVTNAQGGESFHNYGVAADNAFYDEKGKITWPETGDYAKLWTRYGERAKQLAVEAKDKAEKRRAGKLDIKSDTLPSEGQPAADGAAGPRNCCHCVATRPVEIGPVHAQVVAADSAVVSAGAGVKVRGESS